MPCGGQPSARSSCNFVAALQVPYCARVELAGQTSAPLVVKPTQDTLGVVLELQPTSPVPGRPGQPAAAAMGMGMALAGGAGGDGYGHFDNAALLRGSGSKLMTSPSKAMKVRAWGEGRRAGAWVCSDPAALQHLTAAS